MSLQTCESGESRRISECEIRNGNVLANKDLRHSCESGESPLLRTCAGAAHGDSNIDRGEEIREIRQVGADALWTAFVNREDIFAIADRLALSPDEPVDAWRLVVLRIARSDAFMQTAPQDVPMTRDDWERWKALEASPRKLLSLLRKLIYGVRIWD